MDQDTIKRIFQQNIGRWVRVRYEDGVGQFVFIINVDQEGYVHRLNEDDELFWTTFSDVESVSSVSDSELVECGLISPT